MRKKMVFVTCMILWFFPHASVAAEFTVNSQEFKNVIVQLDMQGHADDELSTCTVKQMYYEEVIGMLNDGMSEAEIIDDYVSEYGQAALRAPATNKSGWIAWGMPFAGLAAGIAIVAAWLKKVKGKAVQQPATSTVKWESETEREIAGKVFDEERRKHF